VAFNDRERLCGEEAFAHVMGDSTVTMFNLLMGKTIAELQKSDAVNMQHRRVPITADDSGRLMAEVTYNDKKQKLHVTALTGMYLAQLKKRIREETVGAEVQVSIALPVNHKHSPSIERAFREAATIAGLEQCKVFTADAADCLVATYSRKIAGLNPSERGHLEVSPSIHSTSVSVVTTDGLTHAQQNHRCVLTFHDLHIHRESTCCCWTWATRTPPPWWC
jgi:hypothetical protein